MQPAQNQQQQSRAKRLTLSSINTEPKWQPPRVLIYGAGKVGKTTFAAAARNAIILGAEDGAENLKVPRFPLAQTLADVYDALDALEHEKHTYETLGLDTVDWIEALIGQHLCHINNKKSLKAFGYNEGYVLVYDEFRRFIQRLEKLRAKGMGIVACAHSIVRLTKNPEGEDFDRHTLKLQEVNGANVSGLWKEWVDFILFAKQKTFTAEDDRGAHKAVTDGSRVIYTQPSPAYDAGSRLAIPAELPLEWPAFARAVKEAFEKQTGGK